MCRKKSQYRNILYGSNGFEAVRTGVHSGTQDANPNPKSLSRVHRTWTCTAPRCGAGFEPVNCGSAPHIGNLGLKNFTLDLTPRVGRPFKQRIRTNNSQHHTLNQMPFTIYLHKSTLTSANSTEAREVAVNALVHSLNEQRKAIRREFGFHDWVVVL